MGEEAVRAVLAELAREPQYQPPHRELDETFWMNLLRWLFGDRGFGTAGIREGLAFVAYGLAGAVAVVLALLLWRVLRRHRARGNSASTAPRQPSRTQPVALDPFEEAGRAWANGDGRGATSALYRGAIEALDARGLVRAEPSKLASAYRVELGPRPERTLWDQVAGPFYAVVFGGRTLLPAEFEGAKRAARDLASGRAEEAR